MTRDERAIKEMMDEKVLMTANLPGIGDVMLMGIDENTGEYRSFANPQGLMGLWKAHLAGYVTKEQVQQVADRFKINAVTQAWMDRKDHNVPLTKWFAAYKRQASAPVATEQSLFNN